MTVAVVAGGSSGIGQATLKELRRHGVDAYDFSRASGVDVTKLTAVITAYEQLVDEIGVPQLLVASAGRIYPDIPFPATSLDCWREAIDVNLTGTFIVVREHVAWLLERNVPGRIVLLSSASAKRPSLENLGYGVAKAGVEALGIGLARGLEPFDIQVHVLRPSHVDTPMLRARWGDELKGHTLIPASGFAREIVRLLLDDVWTDGQVVSYGGEIWMKQT